MNHNTIAITDPTFVQDITNSQDYVWLAASWLSQMGHTVQIPPLSTRLRIEDRFDHADDGDMFLVQKLEIKHRRFDFFGKHDFPYDTVLVDVAHKVDKLIEEKKPLPYRYVIFNVSGTGCFIVKPDTFKHWRKVEKYDTHAHRSRWFYEVSLDLVTYHEVR